jgi:hypothetical protein
MSLRSVGSKKCTRGGCKPKPAELIQGAEIDGEQSARQYFLSVSAERAVWPDMAVKCLARVTPSCWQSSLTIVCRSPMAAMAKRNLAEVILYWPPPLRPQWFPICVKRRSAIFSKLQIEARKQLAQSERANQQRQID